MSEVSEEGPSLAVLGVVSDETLSLPLPMFLLVVVWVGLPRGILISSTMTL